MKKTLLVWASICVASSLFTSSANAKAFVLPHVLEKSGTINNTPYTFDTEIHFTYTGSLPGVAKASARGAAEISVYVYDNDGNPMVGSSKNGTPGTVVANPATFTLSANARKHSIRLDDLIVAAGGFDSADAVVSGFVVIVVKGDTRFVNMRGFVVNSHTGPFDLSVFGFDPVPITAS